MFYTASLQNITSTEKRVPFELILNTVTSWKWMARGWRHLLGLKGSSVRGG